MAVYETTTPYTAEQSVWRERRHLHPKDIQLRAAGWQIFSRVKGQEPVWIRKGRKRKQSDITEDELVPL